MAATAREQAGTYRTTNTGRSRNFQINGSTSDAMAIWPISTPRLKDTSGIAAGTPLEPMPRSRSAEANPSPCTRPKPNVSSQRLSKLWLNRFSNPTYTIETAMSGSTIFGESDTILNVASASVTECATVNAVMVFTAARNELTTNNSANKNAMWS